MKHLPLFLQLLSSFFPPIHTRNGPKEDLVLILADDQDVQLFGMSPMDKTKRLLGEEGVTFKHAYVTTPICCPSRSSILTGTYAHNHGTVNNTIPGGCYSKEWIRKWEPRSFAPLLKKLGYVTFYAGKYLNWYGGRRGLQRNVPVGWDWWQGLVGNSRYYNYRMVVNETTEYHGYQKEDYLTTLIGRQLDDFLNFAKLYLKNFVDDVFKKRWETLLSVDDLVEKAVRGMEGIGRLNRTNFIYTSDNGYHLGQYSLPIDKRHPYEFDINVPLIIRGPRFPRNLTLANQAALNIDIAPTLLDLAGGKRLSKNMDGRSLLGLVEKNGVWRKEFVVEYWGKSRGGIPNACAFLRGRGVSECHPGCVCEDAWNNTYSCLRTVTPQIQRQYCHFKDNESFVEFYDIKLDPYQLKNRHLKSHKLTRSRLASRLNKLARCSGRSCRKRFRSRHHVRRGKKRNRTINLSL